MDKIINPITGRSILINGATFKKLVKEGVINSKGEPILIPTKKSSSTTKPPTTKKNSTKKSSTKKSSSKKSLTKKSSEKLQEEGCPTIPYDYITKFYNTKESKKITQYLSTISYEYTYYKLWGKIVKSPRKMIWYADNPDWTYYFSKNHINGLSVHKFTPELIEIKKKIEKETGQTFNSLLINEYNPGDSISWHSDDDPWLGKKFIVPSLSFGGEWKFNFRLKSDKKHQLSFILENGSLVIMKDKCQELWEHSLLKQKKPIRYNMTFRNIIPELVSKQYKGIQMDSKLLK